MCESLSDANNPGEFLMSFESSYSKSSCVERLYRSAAASDLLKFRVEVGESDLWILSDQDIHYDVQKHLKTFRQQLKEYIYNFPEFAITLQPYPDDPEAPELVSWMITATSKAGVGPMASVAGVIAGMIGRQFKNCCRELIIENGGDIYLHTVTERIISIYAGDSAFSMKTGVVIPPEPHGLGVCTSAGTVGPSLSFGRADAAVVISPDVGLADAVATAVANRIQTTADLTKAIDFASTISGITGVVVIKNDKMAAWGEVKLVPLSN
jgi:ApbE superfamily uncharacterized protein (UPF0280 family)